MAISTTTTTRITTKMVGCYYSSIEDGGRKGQQVRQKQKQETTVRQQQRAAINCVPSLVLSSIVVIVLLLLLSAPNVSSFQSQQHQQQQQQPHHQHKKLASRTTYYSSSSSTSSTSLKAVIPRNGCNKNRREMIFETVSKAATTVATIAGVSIIGAAVPSAVSAAETTTTTTDLNELRSLIEKALKQIDIVPDLIKNEKWDSVRAILIEHPIYDCWNKNTPMLKSYADALGETPTGDELAALEQREELISHLRYLDMAVYNNVFNPISSEGTNGATKALIDSYYNDPIREYNSSKKALNELIKLSSSNSSSNSE